MLEISAIKDKDTLKAVAELLMKENERLNKRIEALEKELAGLSQQPQSQIAQQELDYVKDLLRQREQELFGASSERRKDSAPSPPADEVATEPKPKRKGHGSTPQPKLRQVEVSHELPEEQQCKACGGHLSEMGEASVDSEEIDIVAKEFVLLVHRRQKYSCACGETVEVAPGPLKLIPGGRYSLAFTIDVGVGKYLDHMPLARQVRAFARHGLAITTQALCDQMDALATALYPTFLAIHAAILKAPVIGADETRWLIMANGKAEVNRKFYVWGITDGRYAAYRILPGRSMADAKKLLGQYAGIVMTDGYDVYEALARSAKMMKLDGSGGLGLTVVHCWMHVRRKYIEAESAFGEQSRIALGFIRELYAIEREASQAPPEERLSTLAKLRNERSRPVVEQLFAWAAAQRVLPKSSLGKAIGYMLGLKKGLTAFLDDPRIPLDNGAQERALRGLVVGRKNYHGSKSLRGTEVAAVMYTIFESAKLCGVDPVAYVTAAVQHALDKAGNTLLPEEFKARLSKTTVSE